MDLSNAFLLMTAISYYVFALVPHKTTKMALPKIIEASLMLLMGTLLLANLWLNLWWLWLAYGALWSVAACLSYLGYVRWKVQWRIDASDEAQMTMFLWDLLIAVACLSKLPFW